MDNNAAERESSRQATLSDVLEAILQHFGADSAPPDRLELRSALGTQYAVRIYSRGSEDFEGTVIDLAE